MVKYFNVENAILDHGAKVISDEIDRMFMDNIGKTIFENLAINPGLGIMINDEKFKNRSDLIGKIWKFHIDIESDPEGKITYKTKKSQIEKMIDEGLLPFYDKKSVIPHPIIKNRWFTKKMFGKKVEGKFWMLDQTVESLDGTKDICTFIIEDE